MSLPSPYAQYQQTSVETATPTRLVVMLYDGAIRFLSQAIPAMRAQKYEQQSRLIGNAQNIIAHLCATLDRSAGGEVAQLLEFVYLKLHASLTEANVYDKPELVAEVVITLRELREAWVEVDRQCQAGKAGPPAEGSGTFAALAAA